MIIEILGKSIFGMNFEYEKDEITGDLKVSENGFMGSLEKK